MSYKFVKITTFYREYVEYYYSRNKNIINRSYKEQYDHLVGDCFAWADFFKKELATLGVDAHEIFYSAEPLQRAWAKENGSSLTGKDLVLFQLQKLKPEIVFIQDTDVFNGLWVDYLRSKVPSVKLVFGWCCNPYSWDNLKLYPKYDFIATCSPGFMEEFKKNGIRSIQLAHAFQPSILKKIEQSENPNVDFTFIGSLIASSDYHNVRTSIIENMIKSEIHMELYSNLISDPSIKLLAKKGSYVLAKFLSGIGLRKFVMTTPILEKVAVLNEIPKNPKYSDSLKKIAKLPTYGLDMFKVLANSKICLNIHGGVAGDYAANMRLYEATGVGSCLITDWKKNLNELFEIDKEIVSFKTSDECVEKVKWLLDHPAERIQIAKAGQQRTLKDHTFEKRAQQLDEVIRRELKTG